jgi:hypothetical protein
MTHEFDRDRVDPGHQDVMTTDLDAALVAANETSNGGPRCYGACADRSVDARRWDCGDWY